MPVPVSVDRFRVDRIDRMSGRPQRGDQQSPVSLDRHRHPGDLLALLAGVLDQQRGQVAESRQVVADPATTQQPTGLVDHGDIVMPLGPVNATEDLQPASPSARRYEPRSLRSALMDSAHGATPHQLTAVSSDQRGHRLGLEIQSPETGVITRWRLETQSLPSPRQPLRRH